MLPDGSAFKLALLGPFRLESPDGSRIEIRSKRGQALLAMLAAAENGERSRSWLQEKLWGSRAPEQANASLRRELSNLRKLTNAEYDLLESDNGRAWLDLDLMDVDIRTQNGHSLDEFLEGLDIPGEEAFEDWLRAERAAIRGRMEAGRSESGDAPYPPPASQIDIREFSEKPAIAVLPFQTHGEDPLLEQIAHGLSEDLINHLSRLRWLPVIARSSSFADDLRHVDADEAGKQLGAQYIVEGTLRKTGEQATLMPMLIDMRSGQSIWSEKIDLPAVDEADALERLTTEITTALGTQVDIREQSRAQRSAQSGSINQLIWRGRWHLNRLTKEDFVQAEAYFEEALRLEPNSPEALIQMTWVRLWNLWFARGSEAKIREVRKMAQKAIIADYDDARGHMLAGIAETWLKQPLRSRALLERAIELNPSLVLAHAHYGATFFFAGEPEKAIGPIDIAIRLSPNDQQLFYILGERAMANLMLENYGEAIADADQSILRRPGYWYAHMVKANALVGAERMEDAKTAMQELMASTPDFEPEYIRWLPFPDSGWPDKLRNGLNLLLN